MQRTLRTKVKDTVHRLTNHQKETISEKKQAGVSRNDTATAVVPSVEPREETTLRGDTKVEPIHDGKHESTLHPTTDKDEAHHPAPTELGENHSFADPAEQRHVIQLDIDGKPVTIRSQIQLYATNDQLACEYRSTCWGPSDVVSPLSPAGQPRDGLLGRPSTAPNHRE